MIKVYQTIVDRGHGNCMQAAIASLFSKRLDEVPNFIEFKDGWFKPLYDFVHSQGYSYQGYLHNKKHSILSTPTHQCYNVEKFHRPVLMTKKRLYREEGVNGYFYASVLSPKYFSYTPTGFTASHAVIIDRDYNIVHDLNPGYKDILKYPLASLLDYNGIFNVMLLNPK